MGIKNKNHKKGWAEGVEEVDHDVDEEEEDKEEEEKKEEEEEKV